MSSMCRFAYTEDEINSDEFVHYIENHKYASSKAELYKLELKTWKLDDVINIKGISGWSPGGTLADNGFEFVVDIDLYGVFDGLTCKKNSEGYYSKPAHPTIEHNLNDKKNELEKILEGLNYKNRDLIICRSTRCGLVNWDSIEIYSVGTYHSKKEDIRKKLTRYWLKEQKKEEEEIKKRHAENEARGIEIPDWETTKKRFNEFIKGDHPKNFLFDPSTNTGYDVESIEDRKRLYQDITKRGKKKS